MIVFFKFIQYVYTVRIYIHYLTYAVSELRIITMSEIEKETHIQSAEIFFGGKRKRNMNVVEEYCWAVT